MKKAAGLNDEQYINQFPFEACLVMKHYLAETVQKVKIATHFLKGLFYFPPPPFPVFFDVKLDLPYIRNRQTLPPARGEISKYYVKIVFWFFFLGVGGGGEGDVSNPLT